jgi:uncharacterized protein YndB with AHSA1/START domain
MPESTTGTAKVTLPAPNQILITRTFNAVPAKVWRAYTEPELVKRWWGGQRGECTSADIDLRVGGAWRYVMTANEGFEVAFRGEYREIAPHERLVNTEIFEGIPDPDAHFSLVTTTFTEKDGQTILEQLGEYRSQEDRDMVLESGMEGGMQESFDALEQTAQAA